VLSVAGEKPIVISETGWPSAGTPLTSPLGSAVFSEENATLYLKNFVSWAEDQLRPQDSYFFFAAMDEPWKAAVEGDFGSHWGVYTASDLKPGRQEILDCERTTSTWGTARLPDASTSGDPVLVVTDTPAVGSESAVCGTANFIVPADTRILTYVNTPFGWFGPKSFGGAASILPDGTWCSEYASPGTGDSNATEIGVFLVESSLAPPPADGTGTLPTELTNAALDSEIIAR
jgi:hypothetical protein